MAADLVAILDSCLLRYTGFSPKRRLTRRGVVMSAVGARTDVRDEAAGPLPFCSAAGARQAAKSARHPATERLLNGYGE